MVMVTRRTRAGTIGGRSVYSIAESRVLTVVHKQFDLQHKKGVQSYNKRYKALFLSVDLHKDFFFSYSYDLTHTLQFNQCLAPHWEDSAPAAAGATATSTAAPSGATLAPPKPAAHSRQRSNGVDASALDPTFNQQFLWNLGMARPFLQQLPHASYWIVPLIQGFFQQHGASSSVCDASRTHSCCCRSQRCALVGRSCWSR